MKLVQVVLLLFFTLTVSIFSITSNINVQFLIADLENGTFQGDYHNIWLFTEPNLPFEEAIWKETHDLTITEGAISQVLGTVEPLNYDFLS